MDTIVALSSGALPSGVAIIRISGAKSSDIARQFCVKLPKPRAAVLSDFKDHDGSVIDRGMCLWFPEPNSFTGEDVAEFQVHGGRAVVARILELCCSIDDVRLAEAGEFARRAFANGKMDLTEAEGLADLIDAETEAQRKVAQYLASGGLRALYNGWQDELLNARAMVEADIDFADEDDVPGSVADKIWQDMDALRGDILEHLAQFSQSQSLRNGFKISLIGKPNAGKSSLLNALIGTDRAIVSEEAGTTRDVVEVRLDLGGYLVLLSDTAGLRDDAGAVEAEGIRRSIRSAQEADLVLHLSADGDWDSFDLDGIENAVRIQSKTDLSEEDPEAELHVTVRDSESIKALMDDLTVLIKDRMPSSIAGAGIKTRYIDHLRETAQHIDRAINGSLELEFRVEHLRSAAHALGRITGQHDIEDVLGRIFSSFCIGK